jgi:hypothetical protein
MAEKQEMEEYVWRFKLTQAPEDAHGSDALTEMVRRELEALLGCLVLTKGGAAVRVDGFRFLAEAEVNHRLFSPSGPDDGPDGPREVLE